MTRCVTHEWTQTCDKSQPTEKIQTDQSNQEAIPLWNLSLPIDLQSWVKTKQTSLHDQEDLRCHQNKIGNMRQIDA
jgi:hypothetical protein